MKRFGVTVMVLVVLFCGRPGLVEGKPVQETTLDDALEKAPIICSAEITGRQFDDLKPGETATTTARFFLGSRYRITEIFRDLSGKLALNNEMLIPGKSNSCLVWEETVKREGDNLVFSREENGKIMDVENFPIFPANKKVILFLETGENGFTHYGWFVSPQPDNEEIRSKIESLKK